VLLAEDHSRRVTVEALRAPGRHTGTH